MNKTKSNKKKSCRQVIIPESKNWTRTATHALFAPCEPLCAILPGAAGTDTAQGCEGGFGPVSEELARDNIGLPPKPSEAGSVGKGGAAK